jgi:CRP-like cAMP-binding protein
MNQLAIEFTPLARRTDPQTSIDAGRNADKFAASHAGRILAVLQLHGDLSPKQISDYTGLTVVQIDRRRHEMKRDGLITVLDEIRHGCQVWRAL